MIRKVIIFTIWLAAAWMGSRYFHISGMLLLTIAVGLGWLQEALLRRHANRRIDMLERHVATLQDGMELLVHHAQSQAYLAVIDAAQIDEGARPQ